MIKLLDIILAMEAEDRRALSAIWIERGRSGGWQARCSICRDKYAESGAMAGIAMMVWERVPDQEYPLDLDEIERDRSVRAQAYALQESGMVGKIDMARFDGADHTTKYLIKTHAGSQQERTRWLLGLRARPENTIYNGER